MVFNHSHMGKSLYLCPPREYIFLVQIPSVSAFFFHLHYLLNQFIDFDQTCKDTVLGGGEKLIKFC